MATIDEILEEWEKDATIDDNHIDSESIKVPKLHSKYLKHLSQAKLSLVKKNNDYSALKKIKFRYYRGELTKDELIQYNWNQWQGVKPIKSELETLLEGDNDIIKIKNSISLIETKIYVLESILGQIKARDWQIKSVIEWKKFLAGA